LLLSSFSDADDADEAAADEAAEAADEAEAEEDLTAAGEPDVEAPQPESVMAAAAASAKIFLGNFMAILPFHLALTGSEQFPPQPPQFF
jgi:hypothetical protein